MRRLDRLLSGRAFLAIEISTAGFGCSGTVHVKTFETFDNLDSAQCGGLCYENDVAGKYCYSCSLDAARLLGWGLSTKAFLGINGFAAGCPPLNGLYDKCDRANTASVKAELAQRGSGGHHRGARGGNSWPSTPDPGERQPANASFAGLGESAMLLNDIVLNNNDYSVSCLELPPAGGRGFYARTAR